MKTEEVYIFTAGGVHTQKVSYYFVRWRGLIVSFKIKVKPNKISKTSTVFTFFKKISGRQNFVQNLKKLFFRPTNKSPIFLAKINGKN